MTGEHQEGREGVRAPVDGLYISRGRKGTTWSFSSASAASRGTWKAGMPIRLHARPDSAHFGCVASSLGQISSSTLKLSSLLTSPLRGRTGLASLLGHLYGAQQILASFVQELAGFHSLGTCVFPYCDFFMVGSKRVKDTLDIFVTIHIMFS